MRRVAVTGVGVVSALGVGRDAFWSALREGQSGIKLYSIPEAPDLKFSKAAHIEAFDPLSFFDAKSAGQLDRNVLFAGAAASEAITDANIAFDPQRTAVITGCSVGGKTTEDQSYHRLYGEGRSRLDPLTIPKIMSNASASWISMRWGITGPAYTISSACASSAHAIGQAFWMIRSGQIDAAIVGGCEAPFALGLLRAWEALRIVSPDTCRPFSADRSGTILGEGAAMLVLEPLDCAVSRGANVYAEIAGFGMSSDAGHLTAPSVEGPRRAMEAALLDASLNPQQIGYINAHGTGTQVSDLAEARAICELFAHSPPVSSTKSSHGHALGAAAALEAAATVLALSHATLPPTLNFTARDPACDIDVVTAACQVQAEAALSNSFAFGGLNATLAFKRYSPLR